MGISKKLLPIKAYYFLSNAGSAPVTPFIPVIAKDLGFSSVAVGWISTAAPIITILIKPLIGSLGDKFSCQKLLFLILTLIHALVLFSFQWAPSLPTSNPVVLDCKNNFTLTSCSEKLKEECYGERIFHYFNSSAICMLHLSNSKHKSLYIDGGKISTNEDLYIQLGRVIINENCINMQLGNLANTSTVLSSMCSNKTIISAQLNCTDEVLKDLINKPVIDDSQVMFTSQFWIAFTIIVSIRILASIAMSFGDTLCFSLLGDKPENFGMQRMWGAIGWGMFSIITGFIVDSTSGGQAEKNYSTSFYISISFLLLGLLSAAFIKVKPQKKSKSIVKDIKKLFLSSRNIIFIAWCVISGIYVAFVWYYLFWFIEDLASRNGCESGWIKTLEGLVLTIHCYAGEIPFFFLSGRILRKIGHQNAMTLVLITFGARFLLYSILTDPWWILPIESLNGITFGIFYATMTTYASTISPPGTEATIQNLVGAIFEGVGTSAGGLLGGYLFQVIGTSETFFVIGSSAMVFGIIHAILQSVLKDDENVLYSGANVAVHVTHQGSDID